MLSVQTPLLTISVLPVNKDSNSQKLLNLLFARALNLPLGKGAGACYAQPSPHTVSQMSVSKYTIRTALNILQEVE